MLQAKQLTSPQTVGPRLAYSLPLEKIGKLAKHCPGIESRTFSSSFCRLTPVALADLHI